LIVIPIVQFSAFSFFFNTLKCNPDIVHITGDVHFLILMIPNKIRILTVHDLMLLDGLHGIRRYIYKLFWFDFPLSAATWVTTVSESTRIKLINAFPGIENKLIVLSPVVDFHFERFDKPFNFNCPNILLIGAGGNKNLQRVLEATCGLKVHLIIVADIDYRMYPQLLSQSYDVFENLSTVKLVELYHISDIVCVCSTDEGFGLPIVEAQIVGRPVLTSNCSSMPEVAGGGALLVDPFSSIEIRNGIERIISDSELRAEIVVKGFENSKRFCHKSCS
jgi:glycosyltransferase involved in cell wall biosynthesis